MRYLRWASIKQISISFTRDIYKGSINVRAGILSANLKFYSIYIPREIDSSRMLIGDWRERDNKRK